MKKNKIVFVELEHRRKVNYSLSDLINKSVFDVSERPFRPVLVTETGLWVESPFNRSGKQFYDKYIFYDSDEGDKYLLGEVAGLPRANAEKTQVAQDLDKLKDEMTDYSKE